MKVYVRGKRLSPMKRWDQYRTLEHGQYDGYCHHYDLPQDLVDEALQKGARPCYDDGHIWEGKGAK